MEALKDPLKLVDLKETVLSSSSRLGVQRLGALVSSFRRWLRYCESTGVSVARPTPLELAAFLKLVAAGGPTAAASMWACFKFYASSFGAAFDTEHWLTRTFRFHASAHTGRQAPELEPWEAINMLLMFSRAEGTHKVLLGMLLMVAFSCVRFEHLQRSHLVADHHTWLEFHCSQGKARKKGSRPAYNWGAPEVLFRGHSLAKVLGDFYRLEMPEADFLLPALSLQAVDLWELTENTAFIIDRRMSRGRFLEIFRGCLSQAGLDMESSKTAGFNRLRRFLPTLGNVMELDPMAMQAIGSWTEVPQGGGLDASAQKARAIIPMGLHYASQKVQRSASVKLRCLTRFLQLYHHKANDLPLGSDGLLQANSWKWPEFQAALETVPEIAVPPAIEEPIEPVNAEAVGEIEAINQETEKTKEDADSSSGLDVSSDSESSSGSASDASAEGIDLLGTLPDDTAVNEATWFRQSKKLHIAKEDQGDGRPVPWCRDTAFQQEPLARGQGFASTPHDNMCQKCLARMPRGLYAAFAEYNGWAH